MSFISLPDDVLKTIIQYFKYGVELKNYSLINKDMSQIVRSGEYECNIKFKFLNT